MLTSKFDLYKTEWLDLVFDDRNKNYGAYELRRTYAPTMVKAMGITFLALALLCGGFFIANTGKEITHRTQVNLNPDVIPAVVQPKTVKPQQPLKQARPQKVTPSVATTKFVPMVVTSEPVKVSPPENVSLTDAISNESHPGEAGVNSAPVDIAPKGPPGGGITTTNEPVTNFESLEVMPLPVGGMEAWSKFLNKNLRFPYEAQQDGVSGKVFLTFIIEKDGQLSNIAVSRPAGHGFDEEALRVLKLAKAWKPGIQNGQPVRVQYTIPINFQAAE